MNKFSMPDWSAAFQDFQQKVSGLVGEAPRAEMEKHFRSAVSAALERMDLVTREEFEQQQEALLRAKQKLAELEARLTALQAESISKKD
jgi:BMFP domain-containing protein YqiC